MIDWFKSLDLTLQTTIISGLTSIIILFLTWIYGTLNERYNLNYKLRKEYEFEQKKKLKEEIAKNKILLLNSIEEMSYRIYNLNLNLHRGWQNVSSSDWFSNEQYFVNSSIYRHLEFFHWVIKTEKDTISVDSTLADKNDILYLTYIKTFKNIFSDVDLLSELGYNAGDDTNHFFKNDIETYGNWISSNGQTIDFDSFKTKLKYGYTEYKKVIEYWTKIQNDENDKNLNTLWSFHLISISFLNRYGHNYQKTDKKKLKILTDTYRQKLKVKVGFKNFIIKNKLNKEMNEILKAIE